jgi:capsular exopolysaccharide synthesis family protein
LKTPVDGQSELHPTIGTTMSISDISGLQRPPAQRARENGPPHFATATLETPASVPLLPFDDSDTEAGEQYRLLRTSIRFHPAAPKVIAISSPMPGDGKTTTAINTAAILALKEGSQVLLIDGDLRQQGVGRAIGLKTEYGLSDVIAGKCALQAAVVRTEKIPGLLVLTAGAAAINPAELLDSDSFRALVSTLKAQFSYIVFDTTPVTAVADFKLVQQVSDGFVLVVRPGHTNRSEFQKALEIEPRQKLLGVVINAFQEWFLYRHPGGYYYRRPMARAAARP